MKLHLPTSGILTLAMILLLSFAAALLALPALPANRDQLLAVSNADSTHEHHDIYTSAADTATNPIERRWCKPHWWSCGLR